MTKQIMKKGLAVVCVFTLSAGLSACLWSSDKQVTRPSYTPPTTPAPMADPVRSDIEIEDANLGAPRELVGQDRRVREDWEGAFAAMLAKPWVRTPVQWNARDGSAVGSITLVKSYLVGVEAAPGGRLPAPAGLQTEIVLDPVTGPYKAVKNANVRFGPDTNTGKIFTIRAGDRVEVHGRVRAKDWFLVAQRGKALGYVFSPLLEPVVAKGGDFELALAGGQSRKPVMCVDFRQSIKTARDPEAEWSGIACRVDAKRWRVVRDTVGVST